VKKHNWRAARLPRRSAREADGYPFRTLTEADEKAARQGAADVLDRGSRGAWLARTAAACKLVRWIGLRRCGPNTSTLPSGATHTAIDNASSDLSRLRLMERALVMSAPPQYGQQSWLSRFGKKKRTGHGSALPLRRAGHTTFVSCIVRRHNMKQPLTPHQLEKFNPVAPHLFACDLIHRKGLNKGDVVKRYRPLSTRPFPDLAGAHLARSGKRSRPAACFAEPIDE